MRKPERTKLPAVAALLLSSDLRLLVRHELDHRGPSAPASAFVPNGDRRLASAVATKGVFAASLC
jgi:hypothetical protein